MKGSVMKYFSYGSNMSHQRLEYRISDFSVIGVFRLDEHDLRFHKISTKDGSGKCDAFFTGKEDDFVLGVLYEIEEKDRVKLGMIEGLGYGYDEKSISVVSDDGLEVKALTYIATNINAAKSPYTWYLKHVLEGAKSANLLT